MHCYKEGGRRPVKRGAGCATWRRRNRPHPQRARDKPSLVTIHLGPNRASSEHRSDADRCSLGAGSAARPRPAGGPACRPPGGSAIARLSDATVTARPTFPSDTVAAVHVPRRQRSPRAPLASPRAQHAHRRLIAARASKSTEETTVGEAAAPAAAAAPEQGQQPPSPLASYDNGDGGWEGGEIRICRV